MAPNRRTILLGSAALGAGLTAPPALAARRAPPTPPSATPRAAFTAADLAAAHPEGLPPTVRIDGEDATAFRTLLSAAPGATAPWLVISGGGENGAFAAGRLAGLTQAGARPDYGVVTGVSTGAMIAPFAFLGPSEDETLHRAYTEITAADVFEFGGGPDSLADTWPLKQMIARALTPDVLARVAAAHAQGRRLLVATTEIDAGRPVLWDMGAIASLGSPAALALFRDVVLASAAVPGLFPPVRIAARDAKGRAIQELHADGGTMAPFYLAPAPLLLSPSPEALPAARVDLVVNARDAPDFEMAQPTLMSVLGRTMSAAIRAQTRAAVALTRDFAARTRLDLAVAAIGPEFTRRAPGPFDQDYMRALYRYGFDTAATGVALERREPGLEARRQEREPAATGSTRSPEPLRAAAERRMPLP
jgi:predicted acylesterase/phospholipase RssA